MENPEDYPIYSCKMPAYEYYRDNFLSDDLKKVYDDLVETARQFKPEFTIKIDKVTHEDFEKIVLFAKNDHPELFWLYSYKYDVSDEKVVVGSNVEMIYSYTQEEALEKYNKIKKKYEPIIAGAKELDTDRQKVDYITQKIKDIATYEKQEGVSLDFQCLVSIFETGKTMCGGYAYGFKFLCDQVGVKSISVEYLDEKGKESHAWNMVKLDDVWYNLDIGFDDELEEIYNLEGKYYLIDNDEFYKTHVINEYLPNL